MSELVRTVIIGGGQAGLALSYYLNEYGHEHIILERARVAESWRSQRWDSLVFQFPSWSIKLPGHSYDDGNPDGFAPKDAVTKFIVDYATLIQAPVRCGVNVSSVRQESTASYFVVDTNAGQFKSANVAVATGSFHQPSIPSFSALMPAQLFQVHSRDYRNPQQLPPGSVLVIGSGASGAQIAEELHLSGRHVYLSVGRHDKAPRRYRGRDIYWWFEVLGIWGLPLEQQPELRTFRILITGAAGGHDIDLRQFGVDGISLLGRLLAVTDSKLFFASDLEDNLAKAEAWFAPFKARMDMYALRTGLDLKPDEPSRPPVSRPATAIEELDLLQSGISSVVWATGFHLDFNWINFPIFNEKGAPAMHRGVTTIRGLYFLGLRRTYNIRSGLLPGVGDDAAYIAQHIASDFSSIS